MTDQEAKKIIVDLAFNEQRIEDSREVEALRKGVIAINEVQAYREIGTVKEFKYLKEKEHNCDTKNLCKWVRIGSNAWIPGCEPNTAYGVDGVDNFKRCPYCGKKIKVV